MPTSLDLARALEARLSEILEPHGGFATLDYGLIPSGSRYGVAVIPPPELKFPTRDEKTPTWDVHLIAGPARDPIAAWGTLDVLMEALLSSSLPIVAAKPANYSIKGSEPLPAYTLTING